MAPCGLHEHGMGNPGPNTVVLIVDDEPQMRGSLAAFLELVMDGTEVRTASGSKEAVETVQSRMVDIALSDHRMPGGTGDDVRERIRELDPAIGRLLMTGAPEIDLAKRALNEGGIDRFFTKPLHPDEVLEAIERIVARA